MTDDNKGSQATKDKENDRERSEGGGEGKTAFEEYTADKECPECGEPIIDVRAACPKCGYEYKDSDYTDEDAGSEFVAGSAVDDEGEEIPDHESGTGESPDDAGESDDDQDGDDDESN